MELMRWRRFIATVSRVETVKKLKRTFKDLGGLGPTVQVRQAEENVKSVDESDVILLWYVACSFPALSPSPRLPSDLPPNPHALS